jgi:DNA-binding CsgD family transcriptional regulator
MDAILELVLHLYRAAQDTPLAGFPDVALGMLKAAIPFCTAIWFTAEFEHGRLGLHRVHLHEEPTAVLQEFAALNCRYPRSVAVAAASPRVAHSFHAPMLYAGAEYAAMRDYIHHYGHEQHLLIADIATASSRGEWLSLYRPDGHAAFNERDRQLLTLLMPHLTESVAVNRSLHLEGSPAGAVAEVTSKVSGFDGPATVHAQLVIQPAEPEPRTAGARAVVRLNGTILHCGARLERLISLEWPDWSGFHLPEPLLRELAYRGAAYVAHGTACITMRRLGELMLLMLQRLPPSARLGPREHAIARLFATGRSYKQIAQHEALSPATVRNMIQSTYRKLGINNKVQLARVFAATE